MWRGEYGWAGSIDARGGVGDVMISGGPRWRQDRGFRGELGATSPLGTVRGEGGWDTLDAAPRGFVASTGGAHRDVRAAWEQRA